MAVETSRPVTKFRRRKWEWKREYWWYAPMGVQFLALMVFSTYQYNRFALTTDFGLYWQAMWLIAHGHLSAKTSIGGPFLHNHFESIMWPLSVLYWVFPRASLLLYLQNGAIVGAEWVAWQWLSSLARSFPQLDARWIKVSAMAMLVLNPATYWAVGFAFHSESFMALTVTGSLYAIWRKNLSAVILWIALTLLCGDVGALMVGGIGLSAILARRWRIGTVLAVVGLVWLVVTTHFGAGLGASFSSFTPSGHAVSTHRGGLQSVVLGLFDHPGHVLLSFRVEWVNWAANLSPGGGLALVSPWTLGIILATLGPATLTGFNILIAPGFQNVVLVAILPVGSVMIVARLATRWPERQKCWHALMALMVCNSIVWAALWLPKWPTTWVPVARSEAAALNTAAAAIPPGAAVVAPQGLVGRFSGRTSVEIWAGKNLILPSTSHTYFIFAPYAGIHASSVRRSASALKDLALSPRATLLFERDDVYCWKVSGTQPIYLPNQRSLPAWAFSSVTGRRVVGSPPRRWYIAGLGTNGNVLDQAYWREPLGSYRAQVSLSSEGPSDIQIWDATTGELVTQFEVTSTSGAKRTWSRTFVYRHAGVVKPWSGWGPWSDRPLLGPRDNNLEVRVEAPAASMVNVYTVSLTPYSP